METFKKLLLLPSNNKWKYESFIEVQQPTVHVMLLMNSNWVNASSFDLVYSLLSSYTNVKKPQRLLFKDVEYLYFYFLTVINNKSEFEIKHTCDHCSAKKTVLVDISTLDVTYAKSVPINTVQIGQFELQFAPRTLQHCYETATTNISEEDKLKKVLNFLKPQFVGGTYNGSEKLKEKDFDDVVSYLKLINVLKVFKLVQEEPYGFPSTVKHYCSSCGSENGVSLVDPFSFSSYYENSTDSSSKDFLKTLVTIGASKTLSFSEFLSLPVSQMVNFTDAISEVLKTKYGKNGKSYFDEVQEEY